MAFFNLTPAGHFVFFLGASIAVAALVWMKNQPATTLPPLTPPVKETVQVDQWEQCPSIVISDPVGKQAEIQAVVLSSDFAWTYKSHSRVERNGVGVDMANHLTTPGISSVIAAYSKVIAVGAASIEGAEQNSIAENDRASRRADQLQLWIKEYVPTSKSLYSLNMGHFNSSAQATEKSFADQRKVVILGVVHSDPDIDLAAALQRNVDHIPGFPFKRDNYSQFDLVQRR